MIENLLTRLRAIELAISIPETAERVSIAAAFFLIGEMKQRIFSDGKASDGSQIGTYSTSPFYQNPNALVGVPKSGVKPQGKNGLGIFKNGNPKKTKYLQDGYKQLRDLTGRQSEYVDLNFSGSTQQSIQVGFSGNKAVVGFVNTESADIIEQNEFRFGKEIIELTQEETEGAIKAARLELIQILESI